MTRYWCERAWLGPGQITEDVVVSVEGTHIVDVVSGGSLEGAIRLAGLTIPGLANCHSHSFQRALRGRTQRERGTFWTWRETMYGVAERLDPDSYYALAKATYQEMALAGITAVGEFHYLHHDRKGVAYDDPNAMGAAVIAAGVDAGLRVCLLDACYVSAGFGAEPAGVQRRFSDADADGWAARVGQLRAADARVVSGSAIHSVRAVPRAQLAAVAAARPEAPLHTHLSE
ncbi:MAG: amidohydrolase family protein, partial [Nocardioidaceae bacterium]|nr:amidohydrolase family protein [Nocardioidaceae bacterium]